MGSNPQTAAMVVTALAIALATAAVMIVTGLRRLSTVKAQISDLQAEHDAAFEHINVRLAAQKAQVAADQASGDERRARLQEAIDLWREAYRTRRVSDAYAGEFILAQVKMLEEDLAKEGN